MNFLSAAKATKLATILMFFILSAVMAFGPTIPQTGIFDAVSTHQIIQAKIDDKIEQVCLPKFEFESEINPTELKKRLKNELESQEAIFHLYHDGLGRPKKQGGMMFASDVYLKKVKMTYTGFLRKIGLKFKVSKTPPHEDKGHVRDVSYGKDLIDTRIAEEKAEKAKPPKAAESGGQKVMSMRIKTIWDVLPKGVIPPSIRRQQKEIEERIKAMKDRPYQAEVVKMDPVRWATGKMGILAADGSITGSYLEGQQPDLFITPPSEKNWLTAAMTDELKDQPCEFIFQLDRSGREIKENGRYFLRDLYLRNLKLSWEEWLQKHGKTFIDPADRLNFADRNVDLTVKVVSGTFTGMRAAVVVGATFPDDNRLVKSAELVRVFPPEPKPKNFVAFAKRFNQLFSGKPADFSILLCPDGKPYTELGQIRARRIYFSESRENYDMLQQQLINGKIK